MVFVTGLMLASVLAAIAWIDFRSLTIPDALNVALAGLGIVYQTASSPSGLAGQIATAVAVFLLFWAIRYGHARISGRIGLGFGDVKMVGACAIWLHPLNLPLFVFLASGLALLYAGGTHVLRIGNAVEARQPFGPFLAGGLLLTWLGEQRMLF